MIERIDCNLIVRNMPMSSSKERDSLGNKRPVDETSVVYAESGDVPYNIIARSMPGWQLIEEDLVSKAKISEDMKKPVITPVSAAEQAANTSLKNAPKALSTKIKKHAKFVAEQEKDRDSYDTLGSKIRNDLRNAAGLYNSKGEKVALV